VFADVLQKLFAKFGPGSAFLQTTAASVASGCTGLLRAFLGTATFFGVGIGQSVAKRKINHVPAVRGSASANLSR